MFTLTERTDALHAALHVFAEFGMTSEAEKLFDSFSYFKLTPSVVTFDLMVQAFRSEPVRALNYFVQVGQRGLAYHYKITNSCADILL